MKDYFAEFLLNPNTANAFKSKINNLSSVSNESKTPVKFHLAWALVATGIGVLSWKASKVYSGYKFSQSKSES